MPTTANPPNPITDPSGMSCTASAKLWKTLDFGIIPPRHSQFVIPAQAGIHPSAARMADKRVPAFAQTTEKLSQLHAFIGAGQEDIRLQEHRQHQRAMRRASGVAVALRAPHVIPGADLALVIDEAPLDDEGLLDLHV